MAQVASQNWGKINLTRKLNFEIENKNDVYGEKQRGPKTKQKFSVIAGNYR